MATHILNQLHAGVKQQQAPQSTSPYFLQFNQALSLFNMKAFLPLKHYKDAFGPAVYSTFSL